MTDSGQSDLIGFVDGRCTHDAACRNKDAYRMVGSCSNCGAGDFLVMFTEGHAVRPVKCPICNCTSVRTSRLATADEIPEAVGS